MKISKLGGALAGLALSLPLNAVAEAAPLPAVYGVERSQTFGVPVEARAIGAPCLPLCRTTYPPCLSGSRWYGPYGYICYHYRPGPLGDERYYGSR